MNYKIWGEMQQRLCEKKVHNVEEPTILEWRLAAGIASVKTLLITEVLNEWRKAFPAYICVKRKDDILSIHLESCKSHMKISVCVSRYTTEKPVLTGNEFGLFEFC